MHTTKNPYVVKIYTRAGIYIPEWFPYVDIPNK